LQSCRPKYSFPSPEQNYAGILKFSNYAYDSQAPSSRRQYGAQIAARIWPTSDSFIVMDIVPGRIAPKNKNED